MTKPLRCPACGCDDTTISIAYEEWKPNSCRKCRTLWEEPKVAYLRGEVERLTKQNTNMAAIIDHASTDGFRVLIDAAEKIDRLREALANLRDFPPPGTDSEAYYTFMQMTCLAGDALEK
jgi:hypothetical protein